MNKAIKGILPINKPTGWTSFDVVNKIKHILKTSKVGHLGTLDPMAEGVLLITIGKATKLFDLMQEKQKSYHAKFKFGMATDTLDITGKVVENTSKIPTKEEILAILPDFMGKIMQIPPKYSAKSINGKRAYELARQEKGFELRAKEVEIYNINLLSYDNCLLELEICCGSGTYIRSIGRDIAKKLNSLAVMTELVRTQVGNFELASCLDVKTLTEENISDYIIPIKEVLAYPELNLNEVFTQRLLNGQSVPLTKKEGRYILVYEKNELAIIEIKQNIAKMSIFLG